MEFSKQEMELFPLLGSKNFFKNMMLIWSNGPRTSLKKQEMEFSKQEMELFHPFIDLWSKKNLRTWCSYDPRIPKEVSETGNGIISPISRPPIKNIFFNSLKSVLESLD